MAADRAINMALRLRGLGEVEKGFRKAGDAGEKSFAQVEKAANGASLEVSEYTARLRRVTAAAKQAFANIPDLNKGGADQVAANKRDFILGAIQTEKQNMLQGKGEGTENLLRVAGATDELGAASRRTDTSLVGLATRFGLVAIAGRVLGDFVKGSVEDWIAHERAVSAFTAELALAGNQTGTTSRQIQEMASGIAREFNLSEEGALDAAAAIATVPGITGPAMEEALRSAAAFAQVTGTELPDIINSRTIPVLQALADRDLKALYDATEGLNSPLRAAILSLAEAGDTAGAQQALFDGLTEAVGKTDDSGLTGSAKRLSARWDDLKLRFGENIVAPAAEGLNWLIDRLGDVGMAIGGVDGKWRILRDLFSKPITARINVAVNNAPTQNSLNGQFSGGNTVSAQSNAAADQQIKAFADRNGIGSRSRPRSTGTTPRPRPTGSSGGQSDAQREADRLKREAETARTAADRIAESNSDVVESYELRARMAEEKVGLEGDALAKVERRHAVETTLRRLNREEIEKEVEALRAKAKQDKVEFDEAAATEAATIALEGKTAALRELADREQDAIRDTQEWIEKQRQAAAILGQLKTPLEDINDEIGESIILLRQGFLTSDQFNSQMDMMAERLADVRYATDETAQAWAGFGRDVGETLADFAIQGGNALDVLQELIRLPLGRLLEQQLVNPVADWIDSQTGNNLSDNVAAARGDLPQAKDFLTSELHILTQNGGLAAVAMQEVATNGLAAAQALALVAQGSATGAGGGGLGSLFGLGASLFGGGGAGPSASLVADVNANIAANPGLFASGTDSAPVGRWFEVGENGRELMRMHAGGRMEVKGSASSRRFLSEGGGGTTIQQTITIPERADPRRTASGIARSTQGALARSNAKGLAMGPRFQRD